MSNQVKWCMKCRAAVEINKRKCPECESGAFWNKEPPSEESLSESALSDSPAWVIRGVLSGEYLENDQDPTASNKTHVEKSKIKSEASVNEISSGEVEKLIEAQNRTTHAVRAFVLFLFYQLTSITIAFFIYSLAGWQGNQSEDCEPLARQYGACEPQPALVILAFLVWIFGVVYSSQVGWREIKKSEMP